MDKKPQLPFRLNDIPDFPEIQEQEIVYNTHYGLNPNPNLIYRVYSSVSEMFASINRSASNLFSSRQQLNRAQALHRGNYYKLPSGLRNLGNTCYMNALLQCMCASSSFTSFLYTHVRPIDSLSSRNLSEDQLRSNDIVSQLANLFSDLDLELP